MNIPPMPDGWYPTSDGDDVVWSVQPIVDWGKQGWSEAKAQEKSASELRSALREANIQRIKMIDLCASLDTRVKELEQAIEPFAKFDGAYPEDIFIEPNWFRVRGALAKEGISLDCVSGSILRKAIQKKAEAASSVLYHLASDK